VFRFIVVDTMWGEFRLDTCTEPVLDGDGAGVTFGCSGARQLAAGPFKTNGLLFIVALQPTRSGCSALHLVAPGASAGASTAGSYAASSASAAPQPGTLADAAVNQFADACDSPTLTPLQPSSTLDGSPEATPAQGGPTITVGAPSNDGGNVDVPIVTTGDGFSRYVGFSVHIRWDPSLFTFASASASGSVLPSAFCVSPILDTDGAGVTYGCASAGSSTSNTGILATIALTPRNSGCSPVHLFTYGGADDGDTSSGTFTVDGLTFAPLAVAYSDASVTTGGAAC
jgi:hypothetical protein